MSLTDAALFRAQDALEAALKEQPAIAGQCPAELGYPDRLEAEHVYISGEVDEWSQEYELTGDGFGLVASPSSEQFRLKVRILTTLGTDYKRVRARLLELAGALEAAAGDPAFRAIVQTCVIDRSRLLEGRLDNKRQLGIEAELACEVIRNG